MGSLIFNHWPSLYFQYKQYVMRGHRDKCFALSLRKVQDHVAFSTQTEKQNMTHINNVHTHMMFARSVLCVQRLGYVCCLTLLVASEVKNNLSQQATIICHIWPTRERDIEAYTVTCAFSLLSFGPKRIPCHFSHSSILWTQRLLWRGSFDSCIPGKVTGIRKIEGIIREVF